MSQPTINGFLMLQSGHWVKLSDGSGPYSIDALGVARLLGVGHDFFTEVGFSEIPGHRRVAALGNNPSVDTGAAEDVWTGGGLYPWMPAATALEILSSSIQDGPGGTGIASVQVNGLLANHTELSQIITLNGTTPVAIPTNIFRINNALVMAKGSAAPAVGATNVGTITIRDAGGGTTRAIIAIGIGITRQSAFTVPAANTLQINSQVFCINRASGPGLFATFTTYIQSSLGVFRLPLELSIGDEPPYRHDGVPGITLNEKTDFCHRCVTVSANGTNVTAGWLGVMKLNTAST